MTLGKMANDEANRAFHAAAKTYIEEVEKVCIVVYGEKAYRAMGPGPRSMLLATMAVQSLGSKENYALGPEDHHFDAVVKGIGTGVGALLGRFTPDAQAYAWNLFSIGAGHGVAGTTEAMKPKGSV